MRCEWHGVARCCNGICRQLHLLDQLSIGLVTASHPCQTAIERSRHSITPRSVSHREVSSQHHTGQSAIERSRHSITPRSVGHRQVSQHHTQVSQSSRGHVASHPGHSAIQRSCLSITPRSLSHREVLSQHHIQIANQLNAVTN